MAIYVLKSVPANINIKHHCTWPQFLDCAFGELVGNGQCNDEANNANCIYDGGDCCGACSNTENCLACVCYLEAAPAVDLSCK